MIDVRPYGHGPARRVAGWLFVPLASICLLSALVLAQSNTGEIRFSVVDSTGAALQSQIEVSSPANNYRYRSQTDETGRDSVRQIPFGTYQVLVSSKGFAPFSGSVQIRSAVPLQYIVKLKVATSETKLTVSDTASLVDPRAVGSANKIGPEELQTRSTSLPGRSVINLVDEQPGWLLEANGVLHPRGSEYQTQYVIDGVPFTENRSPAFSPGFSANYVQSMSILTSSYPAEFGRKLGGVIELQTQRDLRQGLHGQLTLAGGSFSTADGSFQMQEEAGRNTFGFAFDAATTDRYLDPPVLQNYTNHGAMKDASGLYERDFSERDRLSLAIHSSHAGFLVPNEQLQQANGQVQSRDADETSGIVSYQHIFNANVIGNVRALFRDVSATLSSNPLSIPIIAGQDRGFRESYVNSNISVHYGRHELKAGGDADFSNIREEFNYQITNPSSFDPQTPPTFQFYGQKHDWEQSAFVQDLVQLGNWNVSAGLRWDHYQLLVNENALSPRLGASWYWQRLGLLVHASYDRVFQTPAMENVLLSSSPEVVSLSPEVLRLPVKPSYGNLWELGLSKGIWGKVRLDANWYNRDFSNFADDDLLLNTGVNFPISLRYARIHGAEGKLEVPHWSRFSATVAYSYMVGFAYGPATGGLFLGDEVNNVINPNARFPVTQDQRNTVQTRVRYQLFRNVWTAASAAYGSGLPTEYDGTVEDAIAQYGPQIVSRVNFDRGRVRPSFSLDVSAGADIWQHNDRSVSLQGDIQNITNQLNVINFAGLFSGTAVATPRSYGLRLRMTF